KPRAEVLVDIIVMQASTSFNKQITAAIASTGLNLPFNFTPRTSIQVQGSSSSSSSSGSGTGTTGTGTGTISTNPTGTNTTPSSTSGAAIPLSSLAHIASSDFSTTLPSAL